MWHRWVVSVILVFFSVELWGQRPGALMERVTFLLTASPPQIIADGKSTCTITVRVDDPSVPDGTVVHFTSSLEDTVIEPQAVLRRGVARVTLRAGTTPGVTLVTAFFGTSRQTIEVQLLPPGAIVGRRAEVLLIEGHYVAYSPGHQFVAGSGKVRIVYRGWEIKSDVRLDFWLSKKILVAEGQPGENKVVVTNGRKTLRGDRFLADLEKQIGVLSRVVPRAQRIVVKGWALEEGEEKEVANLFEPYAPDDPTQRWVRGRAFILYPDGRLVIRRAQIYLEGHKLIALPLYVEARSGYTAGLAYGSPFGLQGVNLTAYGGFQLDLPVYYRADLTGTGAMRIQYFGRGFGYLRPGFTLSLEEQYVLGERGDIEGSVYLEQITRKDWGIRWQHFHRLPKGQLSLFLDMPRHKDLFLRLGYYGDVGKVHLGLETLLQKPEAERFSYSLQTYAYLPGGMVGKSGISYSLTTFLAWRPRGFMKGLGLGTDVNFYLPPLPLTPTLQISSQLGLSLALFNGKVSVPWQFSANLNYPLGRKGSITLSYSLDKGRGAWSLGGMTTQSLSLNFLYRPGHRWRLFGYGTFSLQGGGQYHSLFLIHRLRKTWSASVELTFQRFRGFSFTDYGFRVAKYIGSGMEVALNWSKSRRRFYFELGMARF